MGQSQQAIDWFDKVVDSYPNSDASKEALTGIKEIYFEQGNPTAFYDYLDDQEGVSYSPSEKDSVLYLTAFEKYQLGSREQALSDFNSYISSFPNGFFILPAHFYRAEIYYSQEQYEKALIDYEWVIDNGISKFSETAYQKAARIHFSDKNYEQANLYYNQFYNRTSTVANSFEAEVGLMRTSYQLERFTEAITYADAVLRHEEKPEDVTLEAHFYKGRSGYELASYSMAYTELAEVADGSTGRRGVEAQYYMARIKYEQGPYQQAREACITRTDKFASYEYWVVKAFILMADNYLGMDNLFQAKATLESILDNYQGDQSLIDEAQEKYDAILAMEEENSRIAPENQLLPEDTIITIDPNE
jgi:tetratricopeptide (TPR) repeat protein